MQFHLDGFRTGDPAIADASEHAMSASTEECLSGEVDVLIVGCGPAGLTLAAQLAAFPEIKTRIIEQKSGPLLVGQADGVACRTMEMFAAFGFDERVLKESYWVNETAFWKPDPANRDNIVRTGRIQDVEDGLSEMPHVILNQARVHDFYLDVMRKSASRLEPSYSRRLIGLNVEKDEPHGAENPVTVRIERMDEAHRGEIETVKARYVVGCDGARSSVRQAMGLALRGDSANQAWGVMDVLAVTNFPDVRLKALIQSANDGSIVLIPREGGYMVRIYIELDKLNRDERVASRNITIDQLVAAAQRVFRPYTLEVKEVAWWSVYEIGQRLCDRFDDVTEDRNSARHPRVFIAGDACHTHSPKAGQGMNVSMQDTFNLGWKLAAVVKHRARPELLNTYSAERQAIAGELIEFDREWAAMLSASQKASPSDSAAATAEVQSYFVRHGRYTAGTATQYMPSLIAAEATYQNLATGFPVGMRFHSAPVVRLADAKPVQLGSTIKADGRWRLMAFADSNSPADNSSRLRALCEFLSTSRHSPIRRYTLASADIDSVFDVRAIFQQGHRTLDIEAMPPFLLPRKGRHRLVDYEKMFCPDPRPGHDVFDLRGIDRDRGCVLVVRPDQYVAHVLPLDAYDELSAFFERFMRAPT